jgi:hypothetical protein
MFKVSVSGFNGVKAQFASAVKDMTAIVDQELESMAKEWVNGAKRDAPVDQGVLKNGISYLSRGNSVEIFSNVFYSPFMEFGTKGKYRAIPGTEAIAAQFKGYKGGDIMQMLRMIVKWVARKGISGVFSVKTRKRIGSKVNRFAEDYAAAWPILMSILKNGVNPHPFFFKQQDVVWPQMVRNIKSRIEQGQKVSIIMPGDIFRPQIITI